MKPTIRLRDISKSYRLYSRQRDRLVEALSLGRIRGGRDFWALKDINLDVEPGTTLGVMGRNGAGKSTLLQVVSGVLQPTSGTVEVNGRLVLLQVGAGVNQEFTGRENIMLNGLILGLDRKKMLERMEEIEAFADIGEFIDQPVKTYSSGMRARLGFAVAVNVEPDVLIVDETLSVGDAAFKAVGLQKMRELRDRGTTIFFVTHSTGMIRNFCSRAILLHKGEMLYSGDTAETIDRYQALLSSDAARRNDRLGGGDSVEYEVEDEEEVLETPVFKKDPELENRSTPGLRHGTGEARISSVELLDEDLQPAGKITSGSAVTVRVSLQYLKRVKNNMVGITLRNKTGLDVFSTNTNIEKTPLGKRRAGEHVVVDFNLELPLQPGPYSVTAAISVVGEKNVYLDWVDVAAVFKIEREANKNKTTGLVRLPTRVEIHEPDRKPDGAG